MGLIIIINAFLSKKLYGATIFLRFLLQARLKKIIKNAYFSMIYKIIIISNLFKNINLHIIRYEETHTRSFITIFRLVHSGHGSTCF